MKKSFRQHPLWQELEQLLRNSGRLHKIPTDLDLRCDPCKAAKISDYDKLCPPCRRKVIHFNIENFIQRKEFTDFCADLGLRSAGFAFADIWRHSFRFLNLPSAEGGAKNIPQGQKLFSYRTNYIFERIPLKYENLIQQLFLVVRNQQHSDTEKKQAHVEDFYYMLPAADTLPEDAKDLRQGYGFHYCPVGEILFVLYAWRLLSSLLAEKKEKGEIPARPSCTFTWRGEGLDALIDKDYVDIWKEFHKEHFASGQEWAHEMERLILLEGGNHTPWIASVVTYLKEEALQPEPLPNDWDVNRLHEYLAPAAWRYVEKLAKTDNLNSSRALECLERAAAFPLLGLYFWITADRYPVTYMVSPVWTSPRYTVKYHQRHFVAKNESPKNPDNSVCMGLALCATAPLERCDWTLHGLSSNPNVGRHLRSTDPDELVDLLRLLARPLVELLFYDPLTDELLQVRRREALAAIMARNLSHNVGSHVLANPRLYDNLGVYDEDALVPLSISLKDKEALQQSRLAATQRLGTFHEYIQQRLDFIARALSLEPSAPEPLFFVGDVLNGFFRQATLLDCLISDLGYPADKIEFKLQLPERSPIYRFTYNRQQGAFIPEAPGVDDLLVGIPGGYVGCQAFYALLENVLRNAAKYAKKNDDGRLVVRLKVDLPNEEDTSSCYSMVLWNNLSIDNNGEALVNVKAALSGLIIDEEGELSAGGHGVLEMKACAAFLAGLSDRGGSDRITRTEALDPFHCDETGKRLPPLETETGVSTSPRFLAYGLRLNRPQLISVVHPSADLSKKGADAPHENVSSCRTIEELAKLGGFLAVVVDSETLDVESLWKDIASYHQALPYRLLIVTGDPNRAKFLRESMAARKSVLPANRVGVVLDHSILKSLRKRLERSTDPDQSSWEDIILDIYERWIEALADRRNKGTQESEDDHWALCIGFEGRRTRVMQAWSKPLSEFQRRGVRVYISVKEGSTIHLLPECGSPEGGFEALIRSLLKRNPARVIAFDNHGISLPVTDASLAKYPPACYHRFGKEQLGLYQSLESPPLSRFAFQFLILSIIEAAVAQIVIVDERVADSTIEKRSGEYTVVYERHRDFNKAGIYPVLRLAGHFVSNLIEKAARNVISKRPGVINLAACEGLSFDDIGTPSLRLARRVRGGGIVVEDANSPDAILIHEGLVEGRCKEGWDKGNKAGLYRLTPAVLRVSGRGREKRVLPEEFPFLEFSVVSSTTYRAMNKLVLVRSVFSARDPGSRGSVAQDRGSSVKRRDFAMGLPPR